MNRAVNLRPLGIGEVLDVAISITLRHVWTLVRICLFIVVPVQVLTALITVSLPETTTSIEFDEAGNVQTDDGAEWAVLAALLVTFVLGLVALALASAACFKAVTDAYLGRSGDWRSSIKAALRRTHSILWITVVASVLGFLAFALCILPGVWLAVAWSVVMPVLLTEGARGIGALRRSFRLVRGFWWRSFAIVGLGTILAAIVYSVVSALSTALVFASEGDVALFFSSFLGGTVGSVLTLPFLAALITVLYVDLRVRKEGFDLALLAARFGEAGDEELPLPPPPAAGAPAVWPPGIAAAGDGEQPPYWPPPPGWKPASERDDT